jgi:hypothetical protein
MNLGRCGFQDSGHLAASEIGNLPFLVTVQCAPFTESKMATPQDCNEPMFSISYID